MFCRDCIIQYVESQVFGSGNLGIDLETKKPALEIKCCDSDGCTSGFRDINLMKVLPTKTWEKYNELQHTVQVQRAGLLGKLSTCPKCGYQAELAQTQMIFECPVQDCRFSSCKKCGKASHIPLRCEEVAQQKRQDDGRLKIEEALSEAKMRVCVHLLSLLLLLLLLLISPLLFLNVVPYFAMIMLSFPSSTHTDNNSFSFKIYVIVVFLCVVVLLSNHRCALVVRKSSSSPMGVTK